MFRTNCVIFVHLIAHACLEGTFATSPNYNNNVGSPAIPTGSSNCGNNSNADGTKSLTFWKCCQEHRQCPDKIENESEKYGYVNNRGYVLFSCECDEAFRTCLESVKKESKGTVGNFYVTSMNPYCFERYTTIEECQSRELPINTYGKNNHNNIVCIEWRNNFERYL
ncbi:hypothetical protein KM043_011682 [Ampulex compressa]|uniref:phospholipase A2 n=1 Tax=Ampulex compressa TaxID=860918 RepID=A0A1W6EVY5_AMPCP|nr:venom protein [Ampulex compressa]KAG7210120.1 hypothetical protein KM043_011682 [Ampulex compressa]